jgi:hypothetical protein
LLPSTAVVSVALNRSPTLLVFVQTLEPDVSARVEPEAITPLLGDGVTGTGVGVGAGALAFGCSVRGVVVRRGGAGGGDTGTSFNCG